jgi:hypothetical protein
MWLILLYRMQCPLDTFGRVLRLLRGFDNTQATLARLRGDDLTMISTCRPAHGANWQAGRW